MKKKWLIYMMGVSLMFPAMPVMASEAQEVVQQADTDEIVLSGSGVEITADNFPDEKFRNYIKSQYDMDQNDVLSEEEISYATCLYATGDEITDLTGIEYLSELKEVNCYYYRLGTLDVRALTKLERLECYSCELTDLKVSGLTNLKALRCANNQLTSLDLTGLTNLTELSCSENNLTSLDVSHLTNLEDLSCYKNQIAELKVENLKKLRELDCYNNKIKTLDVAGLTNLENLACGTNRLKSLEVNNLKKLKNLYCSENLLTKLDVSNLDALEYISCGSNYLACLKMNGNAKKDSLSAGGNTVNAAGTQIDIKQYAPEIDMSKISNVQNLILEGTVFTIPEGYSGGRYNYDCGNGNIMTVEVSRETGPLDDWPFKDVMEMAGDWRYEAVKYVYENGIMKGVGDGSEFGQDDSLTRAMFATMLYRMAGEPAVTYTAKFPDVPANRWYSKAVIWASEQGIVNGYGDGRFGTDDSITREQMAKMLMEYGKIQNYDVSQNVDFSHFADAGSVSNWATDYMKWAVGSGIIGGSQKDGQFYLNPRGNASRVESATMLKRFLEKY